MRSSERQQMSKLNGNKGGIMLLNWYFLTSNLVCKSSNKGWHMVVGRSGQGPSPTPLICHYSVSIPPQHPQWMTQVDLQEHQPLFCVTQQEEQQLGPTKDPDRETATPRFLDYMSATLWLEHCETCAASSMPWARKNCKNNPKPWQLLHKVSLPFYRW